MTLDIVIKHNLLNNFLMLSILIKKIKVNIIKMIKDNLNLFQLLEKIYGKINYFNLILLELFFKISLIKANQKIFSQKIIY